MTTEFDNGQRANGNAMRALRSQMGWTQKELAARAGVEQCQISRIERGATGTPIATIRRILEVLVLPEETHSECPVSGMADERDAIAASEIDDFKIAAKRACEFNDDGRFGRAYPFAKRAVALASTVDQKREALNLLGNVFKDRGVSLEAAANCYEEGLRLEGAGVEPWRRERLLINYVGLLLDNDLPFVARTLLGRVEVAKLHVQDCCWLTMHRAHLKLIEGDAAGAALGFATAAKAFDEIDKQAGRRWALMMAAGARCRIKGQEGAGRADLRNLRARYHDDLELCAHCSQLLFELSGNEEDRTMAIDLAVNHGYVRVIRRVEGSVRAASRGAWPIILITALVLGAWAALLVGPSAAEARSSNGDCTTMAAETPAR